MCLGEICQVTALEPPGRARVVGAQRHQLVALLTLPAEVAVGDWLVCHSGFAIEKISDREARDALAIRTTPTYQENPS